MATQKETVEFVLEKLANPKIFKARAMFGEYALYAMGKVVALICDDLLYVKILPASASLEQSCEKGPPYPGAKAHYIVEESLLTQMSELPDILVDVANALPSNTKKQKKRR